MLQIDGHNGLTARTSHKLCYLHGDIVAWAGAGNYLVGHRVHVPCPSYSHNPRDSTRQPRSSHLKTRMLTQRDREKSRSARRLTSIPQVCRCLIILETTRVSPIVSPPPLFFSPRPSGTAAHLFCSDWVLVDAPAVAEAIGKLEDGQDELSLGGPSFLQTRLESQLLDRGSI